MTADEWSVKVIKGEEGYVLIDNNGKYMPIKGCEENSMNPPAYTKLDDEQKDMYELLWYIKEYFGMHGSKHDPARLSVEIKEKGD